MFLVSAVLQAESTQELKWMCPVVSAIMPLSSVMPVCMAHEEGEVITVATCTQHAHAESDALLPQAR